MPGLRPLLVCVLLVIAAPVKAADITAEQSALLYDLLSPYAELKKTRDGVDTELFEKAILILKEEKLIGSGRPNFQDKDIVGRYGKALLLGSRSKDFIKEIGHIRDLVDKGNQEELREALVDLWIKAGRKKPDEKALQPVIDSLYGTKGAAPEETINHIITKPDHKVEVVHAKAGGRMQVNVIELDKKGEEESRTVFSGVTETVPDEKNETLQRRIKPEKVCTNTEKTDKKSFKKLAGKWNSNDGDEWTISGDENALILSVDSDEGYNVEYKGNYKLGKIYAVHSITDVRAIGNSLPQEIQSQLINKGHSFRVHLENCNDKQKKLRGTWSSQHVTYNSMFMTVSRVHDPYDVSLILSQGKTDGKKKSAEGAADSEIP